MSESYEKITRDIRARQVAPIYFIHGEECFFTDRLVELFENFVPEEEKDFNMFSMYALEKEPEDVIDIARRYPMMSDKTVVLVKEVQAVKGGAGKWVNKLAKYASKPSPTTLLVVIARGATVACKEFTDAVKKSGGIIFESQKIKDEKLPSTVSSLIKNSGLSFEPKAIEMLTENIGNDLSKIYNEILKLKLILPPGATITPESVEANIGISREYNNFELVDALSVRDNVKALKIIRHFNLAQRDNPWVVTLSAIYNTFSNALVAYYTSRTDAAIMEALGTRWPKILNTCKNTMRNYSPAQIIEIIGLLREADAHGKGNGSRLPVEVIMENLVLKIFMATGKIS